MLFEGTFITNTIKALSSIATAQLTMGKIILSPQKANGRIRVVKSHSPQCVSVLLSVQYLGCLTPGYVRPRTQAPVSDEIIW